MKHGNFRLREMSCVFLCFVVVVVVVVVKGSFTDSELFASATNILFLIWDIFSDIK